MHDRKVNPERPDLVGEHKYSDSGQIALFLIFLPVWISDSFILHYSDFLSDHVPPGIRLPVAGILLGFSAYAVWTSHKILFDHHRESPEILHDGIFGRVRHPLYIGCVLFYLALSILTLSLAALGLTIIIIGFYHFIARYEERLLTAEFGTAYEEYMASVPMWIPHLRSSSRHS